MEITRRAGTVVALCCLALLAAMACGAEADPAAPRDPVESTEPTEGDAASDEVEPTGTDAERADLAEPPPAYSSDDLDRDETLAAVSAARDVYGLDPERAESAFDLGLWRSEYAVFAHDDEMEQVERRALVHRRAAEVIASARDQSPNFSGGWIDPQSGELVLAFTDTDGPAALAGTLDVELLDLVRFELHEHAEGELEDLRSQIESELLGPDGFPPGVEFVGLHPAVNAVVVGVIEAADVSFEEGVVVVPVEEHPPGR